MSARARVLHAVTLALALAIGALALHACGDQQDERVTPECGVCEPGVDQDCFSECQKFCLPDEDCVPRCEVQCDECKSDLACRACVADCTGADFRCAPAGEEVTCEDGQF